ncbi:Cytochrome P450 77A3 [Dendrobium catenatum]|uniref:Cytochrome P450 77A3 n=1 Tax=Dendrobium catenatum TaxID=906689 RepID=A0A2I0VMP7_9ASPA|nr:Cytochrome P450 77A3 [Dendrobium catenatum]
MSTHFLISNFLTKEGGGLTDDEIVVLCHEFLVGGIDTMTTALEWTMAELVKNQSVQSKLWAEIKSLMESDDVEIIEEEDLQRMSYLKALVMESLRRHPLGHFVLPHSGKGVEGESSNNHKGAREALKMEKVTFANERAPFVASD